MRRDLRVALVAALSLALGACETWYNKVPSPDDLMHAVPWFDHMITQLNVHPYARADIPRETPAGAVPTDGGEPDWAAEWATGNATTADRLVNPTRGRTTVQAVVGATIRQGSGELLPGDSATTAVRHTGAAIPIIPATIAARGDTLYGTYCEVCHGALGDANGPVSRKVGAPSLLTPKARGYTDGYLYSIIRYGRGVMPRYGDKVYEPIDRWAIVNHIRALQGAAPAPADSTAGRTGGTQ